jgi:hypothetical protein
LSVHYIVSINESRFNLPEWSNFKELKAEVQIRTVLQHLGKLSHTNYLTKDYEIPTTLERKLRLAGSFELADEEFLSIRNEHQILLQKLKKADSENEFENEEINFVTLRYLFTKNEHLILNEIEQLALEAGFSEDEFDERPLSFISALIEITQILKIETIKDLLFILNKNKQKYKEYFESIFSKSTTAYWTGTQAFYVGLALIFEFDINQLKYYLKIIIPGIKVC